MFLASGLPYAFIITHNADDVKHHPLETFQNVAQSFYNIFVDFAYLLPKSEKDKIKAHAARCGDGSINAFVNRAIAEAMERDNAKLDAQQAAELEALAHAHKPAGT